jgi:RNase adaptor protein for sRNA GlmZ degradation
MSVAETLLTHATCIALDGDDGPCGVLLRGPSGAGKSDLALRMIDQGARLVADDQCALSREGSDATGRLIVRPPAAIAGAIEVRGVGLRNVPSLAEAPLALIVDLVAADAIERLPDAAAEEILGIPVPRLALDPFAASAPAKLRLALHGDEASVPRRPAAPPAAAKTPGKAAKPPPNGERRRIVVVTGLSGAGHSSALKILEDLGYESVDNLPLSLLDALLGEGGPIAVGVDIRTRNFAAQPLLDRLDQIQADAGQTVTLLFLDCTDEALERRFTETRRRHPLAQDRRIADGIAAERRLVAPLRARADLVIDTSSSSVADLRRILGGHFTLSLTPAMSIFVTSFSYRYGLPREADLVLDVRFLANPHYQADLRELDGRDKRVDAFVAADPAFAPFFAHLTNMLAPLLPRYEQEGKSYLTIAIGCTGGRHRSVAVTERLAAMLASGGREVHKNHRDVARGDGGGAQRA